MEDTLRIILSLFFGRMEDTLRIILSSLWEIGRLTAHHSLLFLVYPGCERRAYPPWYTQGVRGVHPPWYTRGVGREVYTGLYASLVYVGRCTWAICLPGVYGRVYRLYASLVYMGGYTGLYASLVYM